MKSLFNETDLKANLEKICLLMFKYSKSLSRGTETKRRLYLRKPITIGIQNFIYFAVDSLIVVIYFIYLIIQY